MADISELVTYDKAFPVEIKTQNGESAGFSINLISFDSERVARVAKVIDTKRWKAVFDSVDKTLSPELIAEFSELEDREKLIAAIDGWN